MLKEHESITRRDHPSYPYPLGATVCPHGVNFSIYSKNCDIIELLLFDTADDARPQRVIPLNSEKDRTFYYWHVFVPDIQPGQIYAYRAYGPLLPQKGHHFDGWKVLLDPYGRAVVMPRHYDREAAKRPGDNCARAMKNVVVEPTNYDWENDKPLNHPYTKTIIYELHVRGFTANPNSGLPPELRGTYRGLIEKIPYLKELGITAVELLPVQHFDPQDAPAGLNYWGYSPIAFFAPHAPYSSDQSPLGPVNEFRDMVKALHQADIEVILDVVFNHTAEAGADGPTLSFRGLGNRAYYILDEHDPSQYRNYSGCGNTFNTNHAIPRRLILDCLRYWVAEMHVDGFRFDLASVMSRDEWGTPLKSPPILWDIESDPVLAGTKIIAEAWDAAGLYQVGSFVGHRWAEWNGHFRDDVRAFLKGDKSSARNFVNRLIASPDLYPQPDREPDRSINFITCHDGFTLMDLVSYNEKHNEANGEGNRDGHNHNLSWNCGVEGPTDDPDILALRQRQIKNFLTVLFLSQGTPMLWMGDEVGRTQYGNNNAYCQDNEIGWFDWDDVTRHADLLNFVRRGLHYINRYPIFQDDYFWSADEAAELIVTWHGTHLYQPDWSEHSHTVAFTLRHPESKAHLCVLINAYWEPLNFELLPLPLDERWHRMIDTYRPAPEDFVRYRDAPQIDDDHYRVQPRSVVVLVSQEVRPHWRRERLRAQARRQVWPGGQPVPVGASGGGGGGGPTAVSSPPPPAIPALTNA